MSQSSLLDHMVQWSKEECQQNLNEALPKLICFLPVCPLERLESEVFSKIKDQILETSVCLFKDLTDVVQQKSSVVEQVHLQLSSLLQSSIELVGYVDEFVCCLKAQDDCLKPVYFHSLPLIVLPIIHQSYTHCKDSSHLYGELLGVLTEQLSALFKKAHSLQMNFLSVLDKLSFVNPSDQDVSDLSKVLRGLHGISGIAVSLEIKIMIVMWKTISRLACQHRDVLLNSLEVEPMLLSLAVDMKSSFTYMIQVATNSKQPNEKTFTKTTKVLGFQMKVMVTMVKEYEAVLSHCVLAIGSMMLTIQSALSPSVSSNIMGRIQQAEINKQLAVAVEPLVSYLIPNTAFMVFITKVNRDSDFDHWLGLCMILVTILKMLPNYSKEVQKAWINPNMYLEDEPRQPILKALFAAVPHCYAELCLPPSLPSIMCKGRPQRDVTLYHHLCSHICAFVATHPAEHFSVLEECLLENVLNENIHNTLLATDVWCFVARYGTADLCLEHCTVLAQLVHRSAPRSSVQCCHLVNALKRLFKYLAPEHEERFIHQFPVDQSLTLYGVLPLSVFSPNNLQQLCAQLLPSCTAAVNAWMQTNTHHTSDACKLVDVFRVLCNLCESSCSMDQSGGVYDQLIERSVSCMTTLSHTAAILNKHVQQTAAAVIEFLAYNSEHMDNNTIQKILAQLVQWLKSDQLAVIVKVSILYYLRSLGNHVLSPDAQQVLIMREMPQIFSRLLADSNPLVHQVALENFSRFAEETIHETIVAESLQCDEKTQTAVVIYLNALSNECPVREIDYNFLKKQQDILDKSYHILPHPYAGNTAKDESVQQPSKRCRLEASGEEINRKYQDVISTLRQGIEELRTLYADLGHIPSSCSKQLVELQSELTHVLGKS